MIGRLRGRTLGEIRVRSAQLAAVLLERAGWHPEGREPSDERIASLVQGGADPAALLADFRARRPGLPGDG